MDFDFNDGTPKNDPPADTNSAQMDLSTQLKHFENKKSVTKNDRIVLEKQQSKM